MKRKEAQERSESQSQKEMRELSKTLLAQVREQKRELLEEAVSKDAGEPEHPNSAALQDTNQFEVIETFLESLTQETKAAQSKQEGGAKRTPPHEAAALQKEPEQEIIEKESPEVPQRAERA